MDGLLPTDFNKSTITALSSLGDLFAKKIEALSPQDRLNLFMERAVKDPRNLMLQLLRKESYQRIPVTPDRLLLKELVTEGLIEMEERVSKRSRQYYLWKFPSRKAPFKASGEK